jgi:hypothetical protein
MRIAVIQRMPESLSALFNIVSFTAANTSRIFDVSVACVRLAEVRAFSPKTGHRLETHCG